MNEELLQYIWQYKYLLQQKLFGTKGELISVIMPGTLNKDSGPDFFNARLTINNTLWAGNIEIHIKSSDWKKHKHQNDAAYNNVVLHVVLEYDEPIFNSYNEEIPTLELKKYLPEKLIQKYQLLKSSKFEIPCEKIFIIPENFIVENWLERLSIERLEYKCSEIKVLLNETRYNWEQVFYKTLARYFGQKINALPFEILANQLPFIVLTRNRLNLIQTQAIILGISGFLEDEINDQYLSLLKREFEALKYKYQFKIIDKSLWKFGKTRPANFPPLRLLQFAQLIHESEHLFSGILKAENLAQVYSLFHSNSVQTINIAALHQPKTYEKFNGIQAGKTFILSLLINAVIPILFAYGKWSDTESYCVKALRWLSELKPEENHIIKKWYRLGIKAGNAKQSQAIIALNNYYCMKRNCLKCTFGNYLLLKNNV